MVDGFKDIYSKDVKINNYLKLLKNEVIKIQKYFYSKDKRFFEKIIIIWEKIYQELF